MDFNPMGALFSAPLRIPLTPANTADIEQAIDVLICDLLPRGKERQAILAMALSDKIDEYIRMAERTASCHQCRLAPEVRQRLYKLRNLIRAYYHRLN